MPTPSSAGMSRTPALLLCLCVAFAAAHGYAQQQTPAPANGSDLTVNVDVVAKRLDIAREQIEPSLGASTYKFTRDAVESQPQGDNAPLNDVLLQAPGVAQDSFGQLH